MKIRVVKTNNFLLRTRDVQQGDEFVVVKRNDDLGSKRDEVGFLVECKNGKMITLYSDEVEIVER